MELLGHLEKARGHGLFRNLGKLETDISLTTEILTRDHITLPGTLL
jgi:hypothetical protein